MQKPMPQAISAILLSLIFCAYAHTREKNTRIQIAERIYVSSIGLIFCSCLYCTADRGACCRSKWMNTNCGGEIILTTLLLKVIRFILFVLTQKVWQPRTKIWRKSVHTLIVRETNPVSNYGAGYRHSIREPLCGILLTF